MSERLSKEEAAKYLGISVRSLERATTEARIGVQREPVAGQAKPAPRYDVGELQRFKAELSRVVERPAVQVLEATPSDGNALQVLGGAGENTLQTAQALAAHITAQVLEQVLANQSATSRQEALEVLADRVVLAEKILLDLSDAQVLTGLSRARLRAAIDSGDLQAKRQGRKWMLRRSELLRWIEADF